MKKILIAFAVVGMLAVMTMPTHGQVSYTVAKNTSGSVGIQWVTGLTWEQVKQKAKAENKYIFVDCYTTWCAPCKRMDAEVYGDRNVGQFMNEKFINVKLQMDKTKKDDEEVKAWYKTASMMEQEYSVTAFPYYLFFNPAGEIVHRDVGYAEADKFTSLVSKALRTESQFYALKMEFENGKRDFSKFQYLLDEARRMRDYQFAQELTKAWFDFLYKKGKKEIYKKENLQFLASALPDTKSQWFKVFSENGEKVNKIMGQSGFSRRAIDSAIAREYINPKLDRSNWIEDPGWEVMYQEIKKDFGESYAKKNIVVKKFWWYCLKENENREYKKKWWEYFVESYELNALDTSYYKTDIELNAFAYEIVAVMTLGERIEYLDKGLRMMKEVVNRSHRLMGHYNDPIQDSILSMDWKAQSMDNYASLLYIGGKRQDAIEWIERAVIYSAQYAKRKYNAIKADRDAMVNGTFLR